MIFKSRLTAFFSFLGLSVSCVAAPPFVYHEKVQTQGITEIDGKFGKVNVMAKILTHEIDIGVPSDPLPTTRTTNCTYSRYPCSSVDNIEISVNGTPLFVGRSVYADLADVGVMSLHQKKRNTFVLVLDGGDASEVYSVEIVFDKKIVRQRIFKIDQGAVMQKTYYFPSPEMD